MTPTFGSCFAGIGGFDRGLELAGFQCAWQVEINPWARKVLTKHWPNVPKYEDINEVGAHNLSRVEVICGGFPCQDLSVAGKRAGITGQRSGLFYQLMRVVRELEPEWVLFENVPGLLTSGAGRDFHAVLSEMADSGFRRAYRILDSQYVGVAQRRRRVFLVGSARATGGDPAAVLLESASVRGDSAPRQEAGEDVAFALTASVRGGGDGHGNAWNSSGRHGEAVVQPVVFRQNASFDDFGFDQSGTLNAQNHHAVATLTAPHNGGRSQCNDQHVVAFQPTAGLEDGTGRGTPLVAVALCSRGSKGPDSDTKPGHLMPSAAGVRRLTATECERLQSFPDGHTCLCGVQPYTTATCRCPDTPRYAGLGNAVTVNVIEWIGRRLLVEMRRLRGRVA